MEKSHDTPIHRFDTIAYILMLSVVLLLPLAALPSAWLPLDGVKMLFFAVPTLAALILWAIARLNTGTLAIPRTYLLVAAPLLALATCISALFSGDVSHALVGFGLERDTTLAVCTFIAALLTTALVVRHPSHVVRLQQAALGAFAVLGIFHVLRLTFGGEAILPTLFSTDVTTSLLGSWSDLAVFSGLLVVLALSALALLRTAAFVRGVLYVALGIALLLLAIVNLATIWTILLVMVCVLALYLFSEASYDRETQKFTPRLPLKRLVPSAVVMLISIVFILAGAGIGERISQTFNVFFLDVRPSWEGTVGIGASVYQENPFFGVGPNAFERAWVAHRPLAVNETNFWDADFTFGVGYIPTAFVTGGLFVGIAWLLFLAAFCYLGFRMLARRLADARYLYIVVSSYIAACYLLITMIVHVPQTAMLAYTFIFIGIAIAVARISGAIQTRTIDTNSGYGEGLALMGVSVVIVVLSFGALVTYTERTYASAVLARAVSVANAGNLDQASALASRAVLFGNDTRVAQLQTRIGITRLAATIQDDTLEPEALQARFQEELTQTIQAARAVVSADTQNYSSWMLLGDVYAELIPLNIEGARESAIESYQEAQARNPQHPAIPMRLARLALAAGNTQEAAAHAQEAIALKSNYTDAYFLLSQIAIQDGNTQEAIATTEAAVLLRPDNTGLLFQLGLLQYSAGAFDRAIAVLERAVSIDPNYANALYFLGLAYDQTGNQAGALAAFERIAALNPDNEEVRRIVAALTAGESAISVLEGAAPSVEAAAAPPIEEAADAGF